jgi:amino acid transporter
LIVEWFSPNFQMSQIWAFEAMIFLIIGGLALARRIEPRQFLLLLVGLGLALHSVRNLSLFMLVAVPALADYAQQARERLSLRWPRRVPKTTPVTFAVNVVMILLVVSIVAVAALPSLLQRVDGKLVARDFPIKAADFLVQHPPPGHMLNVYGWGGYLIFRLDAQSTTQPVFIFGDAALDGDQLLRDYDHLQSLGTDQAQLLERYQINWVIFHSNDPIITELRQIHNAPGSIGWFELKTFDKATIMMRDTPENRAYAAQAQG